MLDLSCEGPVRERLRVNTWRPRVFTPRPLSPRWLSDRGSPRTFFFVGWKNWWCGSAKPCVGRILPVDDRRAERLVAQTAQSGVRGTSRSPNGRSGVLSPPRLANAVVPGAGQAAAAAAAAAAGDRDRRRARVAPVREAGWSQACGAATVKVTVPLGRFSSDRGLKTNEASGMPSPSRSASCVQVVGSGRGTPLTVIVVGSMSRERGEPGRVRPAAEDEDLQVGRRRGVDRERAGRLADADRRGDRRRDHVRQREEGPFEQVAAAGADSRRVQREARRHPTMKSPMVSPSIVSALRRSAITGRRPRTRGS